jgi:ribosomal-protein-serine acetyltransferase
MKASVGPPWDLGDGAHLRHLTPDDAGELFALVDANRERLEPWLPWVPVTLGPADIRAWIEDALAGPNPLDACSIEVAGRLVGNAGLRGPRQGEAGGEVGYWIGSEHEGLGLVTRAVRTLIDHAFGPLGLSRMTILAGVHNVRSRSIPERLGFTEEGMLRQGMEGGRGPYDAVIYGLLASEWPPRNDAS